MNQDILIKYIVGEANPEEQEDAETWIAENPENEASFQKYKTIWENAKLPQPEHNPDVDAAWQRFVQKRDTVESIPKMQVRKGGLLRNLSVAAAVLILAFSGILIYWNSPVNFKTYADTQIVTLPDQSNITLNNHSKLSYTRSFNSKDRVVTLEGEGFFDITKNPDKPFLIHVKDVEVQVLGTSFNVRSTNELTEIAVETGLVKVSRAGKSYNVSPNQKITIRNNDTTIDIDAINNQLYQYYRTQIFVCDKTPVVDLTNGLSDAYGVIIKIENPILAQQQITGKFPKTATVADILDKIALTLNAKVIKENEIYVLK